MMVYLVVVYFTTCGFFSLGSDCVKAETVDRFTAIEQCRETAYAHRRIANLRGRRLVYFCVDRGI